MQSLIGADVGDALFPSLGSVPTSAFTIVTCAADWQY